MGDFRTAFVEKIISSAGTPVVAQAPADWPALADFSRGFLLPACTLPTAGIGRTTGTLNNSLLSVTAEAAFDDVDSLTFTEDAGASLDNRVGAQLLEYVGPPSGPNEVISRGDFTVTLGSGVTTADSSAINGVTTLARCVPFAFMRCSYNANDPRAHFAKVDLVDTGGGVYKVRVTRALGSGTMTVKVRVAEFVGSSWSVQKVSHTFAASGTNEDEIISAADAAHSLLLSASMVHTGTTPAQQNWFAHQSDSTHIRFRIATKPSTSPSAVAWLVTHPQLNVTRYGTPDGASDVTASGSSPESQALTITAVPNLAQACVVGFAGANTTDTTGIMCSWWMAHLEDTTHIRLRRSQSIGNTEYVFLVADFSQIVSARIDTVTSIVDGESFAIGGIFGATPTVTFGGDSVSVISSSPTSIACNGAIGTKWYGVPYTLRVTDSAGGTDAVEQLVSPDAGTRYWNLAPPLADSGERLTALPDDLNGTEQIRCSLVNGGTIDDVDVLANGVIRWQPDVLSAAFSANDGTGWGTAGLQTVAIAGEEPLQIVIALGAA